MNFIKKFEKQYMYRITEPQILHLWIVDIICVIYGFISFFGISKLTYNNVFYGHIVSGFYLGCCFAFTIYLFGGKLCIKKDNKKARYHFCNLGMDIMAQIYFLWSYVEIYYTHLDGGKLNYMPWIFVYMVCVTSFFYRRYDIIILSVVNTGFALWLGLSLYNGINDIAHDIYTLMMIPLLFLVYVFKHISELREFERVLDYERSVESKKLFTASMNHELRTPLNSVIGNAQILLSDDSLNDSQREITDNIFNSSKIMVQLVNDLLDYSKLEAGKFSIVKNNFSLLDLKNTVELMMGPLAKAKKLDFAVIVEEGTLLDMVGDRNRIQQVVLNLISNGIKYTNAGSVKTSFAYTSRNLKIVIIDTGIGMAEDTIQDLFAPYKRLDEKKNSNIQGTGLGMFIVKNLIEAMDGEIVVRSALGLGTTMTVMIPVTVNDNSAIYHKNENEDNKKEEHEKTYDFSGKVILSVDDTVINNKIIENILECVNATTYCCLDAENCIKLIDRQRVDAILLDHVMPGTDGIECMKAIRNSQKDYRDIPIIMVTGNTSEEDVKTYFENGANDFIAKPVMVEELYQKLDKILFNT